MTQRVRKSWSRLGNRTQHRSPPGPSLGPTLPAIPVSPPTCLNTFVSATPPRPRPPPQRRARWAGQDTMPLVLRVLGTQAMQVGPVAVEAPRVKAALLRQVPVRVFHQRGDLGLQVELGPQERRGRAVGEGHARRSGPRWLAGLSRLDQAMDCPWLPSRMPPRTLGPPCPAQAPGQARLPASGGLSKVHNNSRSIEGATLPGIRRLGVRLLLWPHRG